MNRFRGNARLLAGIPAAAIALALLVGGCGSPSPPHQEGHRKMPSQPIAAVLAAHTPRLMALDGVIGVYESALENGSPCIKVILLRDHPETRAKIPADLEGYPVRIEESDRIRPMEKPTGDS